jgi:dienelactone hydrolase
MIRFPLEGLAARAARLVSHFTLIKPDAARFGTGPFPTTIMMHGCGDQNGPQAHYARSAATYGVASIIVDSYTPRRITRMQAATLVCTGLKLWGRERAGDAFAALDWARRQNWVDSKRLSLAGWSHGGWTIMDALALGPAIGKHAALNDLMEDPLAGVTSVFLVYPWSGLGAHTPSRGWIKPVRAFMALAQRDAVVGTALPLRALQVAAQSGALVDSMIYPDATHSFDEESSINPTSKFHPDHAAHAIASYGQWIAGG